MQEILTAITTVGFPIVCCIGLFWKINKQDEEHKEEVEKLVDAVNNNTLAITELSSHLKNN